MAVDDLLRYDAKDLGHIERTESLHRSAAAEERGLRALALGGGNELVQMGRNIHDKVRYIISVGKPTIEMTWIACGQRVQRRRLALQ